MPRSLLCRVASPQRRLGECMSLKFAALPGVMRKLLVTSFTIDRARPNFTASVGVRAHRIWVRGTLLNGDQKALCRARGKPALRAAVLVTAMAVATGFATAAD